MKEPCDHCGEIKQCTFNFTGDWKGDRFVMDFCEECGMKILEAIRKGVS